MYQWWVFLHLLGVFVFLASHGVSMWVSVRLRTERDPRKVVNLLELSGTSTRALYISLIVLVGAGVVAGFLGHWWSSGWIWAAIVVLVIITMVMWGMARPYYRRVRVVAAAKAEGETSVSDEQFDEVLRSGRGSTIMAIGAIGLIAILYFMVQKPTFGVSSGTAAPSTPGAVALSAQGLKFDTNSLNAPAGKAFAIAFDNADPGVPHNVAIYTNSSATTALFKGAIVTGPATTTYQVKALSAGTYFFRCDVHPTLMTGTLVVK